jgi:hypothetical protein
MGHFLGIYSVPPAPLNAVIRSQDRAKSDEVLTAVPDLRQDEEHVQALMRLVDGDFAPGEAEDGPAFVYAFEAICKAMATKSTVVEIYVDEETFPEIFDFVWNAGEVEFGLPMSPWGSPAAGYRDRDSVREYIAILQGLDLEKLREKTESRYDDQIADLIAALKGADEAGRGVYIFFKE